jgi:integrase
LRVRDVNLKSQVIVIPASSTKNGKQRISTIPDVLMPSIIDLVNGAVLRDYLISDNMRPGQNKMTTRIMRYRWSLVKQALDLPKSYMFYSLRDSGIVQKLQDNISPEEVMKQAGHWSLEITTMYVNHFSPTGSEQVKTRASEF